MTAGLVPHLARLTSRLDERLTWWLASCTDQIQALVYGNNSLESTLVDIRHLAQDFVSRLVDLIQSAGSRLAGDLVQLDWLHNRLVTSLALICGILLLIALVYFGRTLPAQIQRCKNKLCSIICVFGKANRPRLSAGLSMLALRSLIRIEERLYTTRWIRDPEAYRLGLRGNLHYIRSKISPFIPKFLRSLTGARTPVQPEVTSVSSLSPEIVERIAAVFAADSMDGLHGAWAEIVEQIKKFYETDQGAVCYLHPGSGTGASTILAQLAGSPNMHVQQYPVLRQSTLPDFKKLIAGTKKTLVILEDIEHAFLRTVGGFSAIKTLVAEIAQAGPHLTWVLTSNPVFRQFIGACTNIKALLTMDKEGPFLTTEDVRQIIEGKLISAGYSYRIKSTPALNREIRKKIRHKIIGKNEIDSWLKNLFFQKCFSYGRDNLNFHFAAFLQSIVGIRGRQLVLKLYESEAKTGVGIDSELLHILHAVILHKNISLTDLSAVLLITEQRLAIQTGILIRSGMLESTNLGFSVRAQAFYQVVKVLAQNNLVQESST